ncbi:MAG: hypothetical protein ACTSSF_04255, partial [Candidatus Heimdallarchaeaceae archaeon]
YYSTWILLIVEMLKVLITVIAILPISVAAIIDIGFDISLFLFAFGIIRMGKFEQSLNRWKETSILLFISGFSDIILIIISFIFDESIYPNFIYVRLVFLILILSSLFGGFLFQTKFANQLFEMQLIKERKNNYYLPIGIFALFFPYITSWVSSLKAESITNILSWIALFVFLIASFFIVVGFLELSFSYKLLFERIKREHYSNHLGENSG